MKRLMAVPEEGLIENAVFAAAQVTLQFRELGSSWEGAVKGGYTVSTNVDSGETNPDSRHSSFVLISCVIFSKVPSSL